MATHNLMLYGAELSPEARGFFPEQQQYNTGPDRYLALIGEAKRALRVPVIASLNGTRRAAGRTSRGRSSRRARMRSS